jgi:tetratricopeptide (TPR) repeat protein
MHPIRRRQIFTNLGSLLDTLGRFIEARACWNAALAIEPNFWMARANQGRALMHYAVALYDPGHLSVLAYHAYRDLKMGVSGRERSYHH